MLDLGLVFHIGVLRFGCIFPYLENMILIIKKTLDLLSILLPCEKFFSINRQGRPFCELTCDSLCTDLWTYFCLPSFHFDCQERKTNMSIGWPCVPCY